MGDFVILTEVQSIAPTNPNHYSRNDDYKEPKNTIHSPLLLLSIIVVWIL